MKKCRERDILSSITVKKFVGFVCDPYAVIVLTTENAREYIMGNRMPSSLAGVAFELIYKKKTNSRRRRRTI